MNHHVQPGVENMYELNLNNVKSTQRRKMVFFGVKLAIMHDLRTFCRCPLDTDKRLTR